MATKRTTAELDPGIFDRWSARHNELASAIQSYLQTSQQLHEHYNSLSHPTSSFPGLSAALHMDNKLSELAHFEEAPQDTRSVLQYVPGRLRYVKPIDRIPNEVLSTIFILALQEYGRSRTDIDEGLNYHARHSADAISFLRSAVSRRWRDIALDTSA